MREVSWKSMKLNALFFLLLIPCLNALCRDYSSCQSIDELLGYETEVILQTSTLDLDSLSEAYLSRGETYLFLEDYEKALEDLTIGYELASRSKSFDSTLSLRSLHGLAIVHTNKNSIVDLKIAGNAMRDIMRATACQECSDHIIMVGDVPIEGPEHVSIRECIQRATNTAFLAKGLAIKAKVEAQFLLGQIIDELEDLAIYCCKTGGLWKGCLQPLANKWYVWNKKWKLLGEPPDPSWD